jgi:hypothetical protein
MAFRQRALQLAIGLVAVAMAVGLFALSERQRERRHANRRQAIAGQLLQLAHLRSSDTIYDLECGDGRVVVTAARQYGARGWCFDIYPQRLTEARELARLAGVENLIAFRQQNWDAVDVTPATVVILWMTSYRPLGLLQAQESVDGRAPRGLTNRLVLERSRRLAADRRGVGRRSPRGTRRCHKALGGRWCS